MYRRQGFLAVVVTAFLVVVVAGVVYAVSVPVAVSCPAASVAYNVDGSATCSVDVTIPGVVTTVTAPAATVTVTVSPTPTPTPTPTPPPSTFPGAGNTGVPAGTVLTAYTGPATVSTANTVIDSKTITKCLTVTANGVVIRNSLIRVGGCGYTVYVQDKGTVRATPLTILDSEIDCRNTSSTAIGEADVTVRRTNIHGCENGFDINRNVTVEDSYIHDLYNTAASHSDGIQLASGHLVGGTVVNGSSDVTITHNTIFGVGVDGSLGTSAIISNRGGDTNILIDSNLLAGGAYTLYCEQNGAKGVNYRVTGNHFSKRFSPNYGAYGPSDSCADETQSGNVDDTTGLPIQLD